MKWLPIAAFVLGCWTLVHAQNSWPIPVNAPLARAPDRVELAPDLTHVDLPINHAKLVWFVSARELPRHGIQPMDRIALAKMMDQDLATSTAFSTPRKYEIVFDLQRVVVVDRLTFVTDVPGCPISVRVAGADLSEDEGKAWRELGNASTQAPFTKFTFRNEPIRFIHLVLDTSKAPKDEPLNIFEFCVFGQEDLRDYVLKQVPQKEQKSREQFVLSSNVGSFPSEMLQNNLASLDAGTSIRRLGPPSGDQKISYLLDDDPTTTWKAPSEKETLILMDFGAERTFDRMSLMHSARPGKLLVYALQHLPLQKSRPTQLAWIERLTDVPLFRFAQNTAASSASNGAGVTSNWLDGLKPSSSVDCSETNFSGVSGNPQPARYVVFRYQNPTPGTGDPLVINGLSLQGNYPLGEFVLASRSLPIIAGAGGRGGVGPPDGGTTGLPLTEQLNDDRPTPVEPPKPTPATP